MRPRPHHAIITAGLRHSLSLLLVLSLACKSTPAPAPPPDPTCGREVTLRAPAYAEPLTADAITPALTDMLERAEAWAKSDAGSYVPGLHDARTRLMLGHELSDKRALVDRELEAHPELRGYLTMACLASGAEVDCTNTDLTEIVTALQAKDDGVDQRALFAKGCRLEDAGWAYAPRFEPADPVVRAVERCGSSTTREFLPTVNAYHVSRVRCGEVDAVLVSSEVNKWWGKTFFDEHRTTRLRPVILRPMSRERFDATQAELRPLVGPR